MKELIEIQRKLKAPKGNTNSFGGYKYRKCEDILEAVKPLLAENSCYITIYDEIVEVGGRIYVKANATITNATGQFVKTTAFAREEESKKGMDLAQVTGAASSYARKYALNGLLAIDDTKDPDTYEGEPKSENAKKQEIDASVLDNQLKCDKILAWLYSMYEKTSAKDSFNAGVVAEQFYTISEHNKGRLAALFNSYVQSKKR